MARRSPDADIEALFGRSPGDFIAARDSLARKLRSEDPEAAARVKRLRRPTVAVWALNQLARRRGKEVAALFEAADRLRAAHRRAGTDERRSAGEAVQRGQARLIAAAAEILAGEGHGRQHLERVRTSLQALPAAPDAVREQMRRGTLTAEVEHADISQVLAWMQPTGERQASRRPREPPPSTRPTTGTRRPREQPPSTRRATRQPHERGERPAPATSRAQQAKAKAVRDAARRTARAAEVDARRALRAAERARRAVEEAEAAARSARVRAEALDREAEDSEARAARAAERLVDAEAAYGAKKPARGRRRRR